MRYAKALLECTKGYEDDAKSIIEEGMFPGGGNDIIIVRDITFHSFCEHHILPFHGKVGTRQFKAPMLLLIRCLDVTATCNSGVLYFFALHISLDRLLYTHERL